MLDETLHKMAHRGARWPLEFWREEYERLSQLALSSLPEPFTALRAVLKAETPDEVVLSKALQEAIATLRQASQFNDATVGCRHTKVDVSTFVRLAYMTHVFGQKRKKGEEALSDSQKHAHDLALFDGYEGTMYSLEFYLMMYKLIRDAKDEQTARRIIEEKEVEMGLGSVPGLWIDAYRIEVAEKFMYLIYDDRVRFELSEAYFTFRSHLLEFRSDPDQPWNPYAIDQLLFFFRTFLFRWMRIYEKFGVIRLKSYLLTPFGDNPLLSDIKL